MSENRKIGFMERLFGVKPQPQPEPERELAPPPPPAPEPQLEHPAPVAELPAEPAPLDAPPLARTPLETLRQPVEAPALAEPDEPDAETHGFAGPPETTIDFVEEVEDALETPPEPVPPIPAPPPVAPAPIAPIPAPAEPAPAPRQNWFQRLSTGLRRSSDQLTGGITAVFTKKRLDEAMLEELEDVLIQADFGIETATGVTDALRRDRFDRDVTTEEVRAVLAGEVARVLAPVARPLTIDTAQKPFVILMAGVNGSGKTTTIGKLAQKLSAEGKSVMLAAGDTFRAAAIEQLQVWGQRTGAPVVSKPTGADASGLAFDAVTRARAEGTDVLIIDTAGRLQNRDELMSELEKIIRVIKKVDPTAPHATLLTLDATTGQNALSQVEIFGRRAGVSGLVMTKLDGTARGGILVAIARRHGLPVHFIGVGEGVDDLEPFKADEFARAIAGAAS